MRKDIAPAPFSGLSRNDRLAGTRGNRFPSRLFHRGCFATSLAFSPSRRPLLAAVAIFMFCAAALCAAESESAPPPNHSGQVPTARIRVAIPSSGPAEVREILRAPQPPPLPAPEPLQAMAPPAPPAAVGEAGAMPGSPAETEKDGRPLPPEPMILAVLDGKPITDLDVMREMWSRRGRETLDWMIGRSILERELARLRLEVADAEVEQRLEEHLEGLAKAFPGLRNPDALTRAASGMRLDEYRERSVWMELALRKIMRVSLKPTEEQLMSYYAERQAEFIQPERVRISQIFIAPRPDPNNDDAPGPADWGLAEKQILEAHTRLRLGENFAEVAKAYGAGGGISQWVGRGELLRELEEAAFSIRPGSISSPLRSSMGYHILRSEEKKERRLPRFEEVREQVRAQYEEKAFVLMAGEFMARLRDGALKSGELVLKD